MCAIIESHLSCDRLIEFFYVHSFGDGVNFPIRTVDEDYDSLLGHRQRWMEEGDNDTAGL